MWLVVGLGNPGGKYAMTRHNVGFMALDAYCASVGNPVWKEEKQALVTRLKIDGEEVMFAKPQTFMNKSGDSVQALTAFYKIPIEKMIVVHDEIDIPFGAVRVHKNRGAGGHNGIKSITQMMGTMDYTRLKLGVGKSLNPNIDVATHVLQNFESDEQGALHDFLSHAGDAIEALIFDGYDKAASKFTRDGIFTPVEVKGT
ncbi:MAG: aminoacyl-tRNA hydrolase [Bdellovibrionota bacterium]